MSKPNERNNENYKQPHENKINSLILLMSMNNLNTEINTTKKKEKKRKSNFPPY